MQKTMTEAEKKGDKDPVDLRTAETFDDLMSLLQGEDLESIMSIKALAEAETGTAQSERGTDVEMDNIRDADLEGAVRRAVDAIRAQRTEDRKPVEKPVESLKSEEEGDPYARAKAIGG